MTDKFLKAQDAIDYIEAHQHETPFPADFEHALKIMALCIRRIPVESSGWSEDEISEFLETEVYPLDVSVLMEEVAF